ncbi:hypothetical protein AV530_018933 [Patagioenas fasciata monilis]|uniref:Uncharacterized protein n=1 Tax=Patagioenas fasciata monilis TaxID=372326 RepID=A0A1V4KPK8_PATFA|nr:hypothetical protein AV530_018933 [Patagioenas fasciata monilis]
MISNFICLFPETLSNMAMVSEFLKQAWFMEHQEQEYIKSVKGGPVVPPQQPNFDPAADVVALEKAMTVKGKRTNY